MASRPGSGGGAGAASRPPPQEAPGRSTAGLPCSLPPCLLRELGRAQPLTHGLLIALDYKARPTERQASRAAGAPGPGTHQHPGSAAQHSGGPWLSLFLSPHPTAGTTTRAPWQPLGPRLPFRLPATGRLVQPASGGLAEAKLTLRALQVEKSSSSSCWPGGQQA